MNLMTNITLTVFSLSALLIFGTMAPAFAMNGPVNLGGDDLTDHGSGDGTTNLLGWFYIEKALLNLITMQTAPGPITVDVLVLGSSDPGAATYPTFNAGGAYNSVVDALGLSVQFCNGTGGGAGTVDKCLTDLASGAIKPKVIVTVGTGAQNDLDAAEGAALTNAAGTINTFVTNGGGLLSHGSGTTAYGWLSTLVAGLIATNGCISNNAMLTAAGIAALPGVTNADISAGPCHNHFTGPLGNLVVFGVDGANPTRDFILGLAAGTINGGIVPGANVAGELSPIDTSALLIAGAQSSMFSIVSVLSLLGAIGIGAFYYNKRKN